MVLWDTHHCSTWQLPTRGECLLKAHLSGEKGRESSGTGAAHVPPLCSSIMATRHCHLCPWLERKINKGQEGTINRLCRKIITPRSLQHPSNQQSKTRQRFHYFINHRSYCGPPECPRGPPPVPSSVTPRSAMARTQVPEPWSGQTGEGLVTTSRNSFEPFQTFLVGLMAPVGLSAAQHPLLSKWSNRWLGKDLEDYAMQTLTGYKQHAHVALQQAHHRHLR